MNTYPLVLLCTLALAVVSASAFYSPFSQVGKTGANGGVNCAVCTILVGSFMREGQDAVEAGSEYSISTYFHRKCLASADLDGNPACNMHKALQLYDAKSIRANHVGPDEICRAVGICKNATCNLYPTSHPRGQHRLHRNENPIVLQSVYQGCFPFGKTCPWTDIKDNLPVKDDDLDRFSTYKRLRGGDWRGRDCDDKNAAVYPGRSAGAYTSSDDVNCNGIHGVNEATKNTYEKDFCEESDPHGIMILGDSAAAHFSVPMGMSLSDLVDSGEDELDWPQCSWCTGHEGVSATNSSKLVCPQSRLPFNSFYLRMRERNRCIHRDYQSISVNGARSTAMSDHIMQTVARNASTDFPAIAFYALIGNDVCNPHPGSDHMTQPPQFYEKVMSTLQFLDDGVLANGSHVVFLSLINDGEMMWDVMSNRTHPDLHVTYSDLWEYFNCIEQNPCWGWLNPDPEWRNYTVQLARSLNTVLKEITATKKFNNFDLTYIDYPITNDVVHSWINMGYDPMELFEYIGGGHPSTTAHMITQQAVWKYLEENRPDILGAENPNNDAIEKVFGDQGGY